MTDTEKAELKQEILNAIKADSQSIDELESVTTLENVNSLPSMRGSELVSVPISLLSKPATDAAALANAATQSANDKATLATEAATAANTAAQSVTDAVELANAATQSAQEKAALADTAAQSAQEKAALAVSAATEANSAAQSATEKATLANAAATEATTAKNKVYETLETFSPYLESICAYGVEFDTEISSPDCTRIGNMSLHRTLPIQNKMRGCLLNDDGDVVKYLNPNDWSDETLDGSQGQVMVELPEHYVRFETEGTKRRVLMSEMPLTGYRKIKRQYVSAFEASMDRSNDKLSSVVNATEQYRGGNNNTSWDGTYRTLLGRPVTTTSFAYFRRSVRKRKPETSEWNCMTYGIQKELYWLFCVEYATLNSQAAFNAEKTSDGYKQGGLGNGVSNVVNWASFNGRYPFVPIGYTNGIGNYSGEVLYTVSNGDAERPINQSVYVNRYRGVENPFGHIRKFIDGLKIRTSPTTENGGDNLSKVYVCEDPSKFNDSNYTGYQYVGNTARVNGYVKTLIFGDNGDILPDTVGGGSSIYVCDYCNTDIKTEETLNAVVFGGNAEDGSKDGFACVSLNYYSSTWSSEIGTRLCFIPE